MKKKKKVNRKKFLSRIFLLVAIMIITIYFISSIGNSKEPKYKISVIVNQVPLTNELLNEPYIDKDKTLYLSLEDIQKIFDKNIYYEEKTDKIITTYGTKVAAINVKDNVVQLNTASLFLSSRDFKL